MNWKISEVNIFFLNNHFWTKSLHYLDNAWAYIKKKFKQEIFKFFLSAPSAQKFYIFSFIFSRYTFGASILSSTSWFSAFTRRWQHTFTWTKKYFFFLIFLIFFDLLSLIHIWANLGIFFLVFFCEKVRWVAKNEIIWNERISSSRN